MGRIERWSEVAFKVLIDCTEQIDRKDLPMWIGKSASLDKQIAKLLQTDELSGWVIKTPIRYTTEKTEHILILPESKEGTDFIEIEMHGSSSGYSDPGSWGSPDNCYPPEGDDEREINSADISFYDEEGDLLHECETQDVGFLSDLETIFSSEIEDADLE